MSFEDRLAQRLTADAERQPLEGLKGLEDLRTSASRRTRRKRAGAGVLASAMLIGVGLFGVNGLRATEQSQSNVIATDPDEEAATVIDRDASNDEPLSDVDPTRNTALSGSVEILDLARTEFVSQVLTTDDGYVAFVESQSALRVITSDDGLQWDPAQTSLPPAQVSAAAHGHGLFAVAGFTLADLSTPVTGPGAAFVAVSSDLIDWQITSLVYEGDRAEGRDVDVLPRSIAINEAGVLLLTDQFAGIDFDAFSDELGDTSICSHSWTDSKVTFEECSTGEELTFSISSLDDLPSTQFWFSDGSDEFARVDGPPIAKNECRCVALDLLDGDFFVIDRTAGAAFRSRTTSEWIPMPSAGTRSPAFGVLVATKGNEVILADPIPAKISHSNDGGEKWSIGTWLSQAIDLERSQELQLHKLVEGDAGWLAIGSVQTVVMYNADDGVPQLSTPAVSGDFEVEVDGFTVVGSVFSDVVAVTADDGSFSHTYAPPADNPLGPAVDVVDGWFSGTRFLRPGTDEVLVTITAGDIQRAIEGVDSPNFVPAPSTAAVDLAVGGWRLSGSPQSGRLELMGPDGDVSVFSDGFAFGNGQTDDGVEISPPLSGRDDPGDDASDIIFYDEDGIETVRFPFWEVIKASLDSEEPEPVEPDFAPLPRTSISEGGYTLEADMQTNVLQLFADGELIAASEPNADIFGNGVAWFTYDGLRSFEATDPRSGEVVVAARMDELFTGGLLETVVFFSPDGRSWSLLDRFDGAGDVTMNGSTALIVGSSGDATTSRVLSLD